MSTLPLNHPVVLVQPGKMKEALNLFIHFGWAEIKGRHAKWKGGQARFCRLGGDLLQFSELRANKPFDVIHPMHLGLSTPDAEQAFKEIQEYTNGIGLEAKIVERDGTKLFVEIPDLFWIRFELITLEGVRSSKTPAEARPDFPH